MKCIQRIQPKNPTKESKSITAMTTTTTMIASTKVRNIDEQILHVTTEINKERAMYLALHDQLKDIMASIDKDLCERKKKGN